MQKKDGKIFRKIPSHPPRKIALSEGPDSGPLTCSLKTEYPEARYVLCRAVARQKRGSNEGIAETTCGGRAPPSITIASKVHSGNIQPTNSPWRAVLRRNRQSDIRSSSHSPPWPGDHAMGAILGDPEGGEIPMRRACHPPSAASAIGPGE